MADMVASGRYHGSWQRAEQEDIEREGLRRISTWEVCQDAGYEAIEFPEEDQPDAIRTRISDAARRACLCFAQQMVLDDERKVIRTSRRIIARIVREAGL